MIVKEIFNFITIFPARKSLISRKISPVGTVPGMRGCFRGCSRRVFEVRITLSKSLTRSRQFRNEIHGDPYSEAFTRRFNLERTIPLRAAAKSGEQLLYDIRTIEAHIRHPHRRASKFLRE